MNKLKAPFCPQCQMIVNTQDDVHCDYCGAELMEGGITCNFCKKECLLTEEYCPFCRHELT